MTVPINLIGPDGDVVHALRRDKDVGLKVFSAPLHERFYHSDFVSNEDEGTGLNVNGAFGGTPVIVHVGISDGVYWTGSNIVGNKADFDSADQAFQGTVSVKVNNPNLGHIWQFDKGSDLTLSSYQGITMKIYVDKDWDSGDSISIYGYDTGLSAQVGDAVLLEDYFDEQDFDTWHGLSIPFADMNLNSGTIDAFRMELVSEGSGKEPKFYIDLFQVEETGTPIVFSAGAPLATKFYVNEFWLTFIDGLTTTLADNSVPNLDYIKLMAITKLANGIVFKITQKGKTTFSENITCLGDATTGGYELINKFGNATNANITLIKRFRTPILLDSRELDSISVSINDDLRGLLSSKGLLIGEVQKLT